MRCLIIGQGIAGTVLAWTFLKKGIQVHIADATFPNTSSSIAAGIINPVTGKRFVKSWRFDALYAHASLVYHAMEQEWGVRIWHNHQIIRLLSSSSEVNDWSTRMATAEYRNILSEAGLLGSSESLIAPGFSFGIIKNAARVDFPALLQRFRAEAISGGVFLPTHFNYEEILKYLKTYDFIVFCEGYRASKNPFFPDLPWQLSKGEAMIIRLLHPDAATVLDMIKKTLLVAPLGNGLFWAGASYAWKFDDSGATEAEQNYLEGHLEKMLNVPYEVVRRMGAVRPTVKDRRPFIGRSPEQPNVYIFNGLGTKGALLAPYWAARFSEHILDGAPLDPEVDIRRFQR